MTARKKHVKVDQDEYLRVMKEVGLPFVILEDIAEHLNVSEGTARAKLDGLVFQGKIRRGPRPSSYELVKPPEATTLREASKSHEAYQRFVEEAFAAIHPDRKED